MSKRRRYIIDIDSDVPTAEALRVLTAVLAGGRISQARGYEKHCHVTVLGNVQVYARDRRSESAADSFLVTRHK